MLVNTIAMRQCRKCLVYAYNLINFAIFTMLYCDIVQQLTICQNRKARRKTRCRKSCSCTSRIRASRLACWRHLARASKYANQLTDMLPKDNSTTINCRVFRLVHFFFYVFLRHVANMYAYIFNDIRKLSFLCEISKSKSRSKTRVIAKARLNRCKRTKRINSR